MNWVARMRAEPIFVPRWVLVVMYSGFIVLGGMAAIAGIPTLDLTTPEGYVTPYALAIALFAIIAAVGASLGFRHERLELVGALLLFSLLTTYAGSALFLSAGGDIGRATFAVVILMVTFAPAARGMGLLFARIRVWIARRRDRRVARSRL